MAVTTLPFHRRNKVVYGKVGGKARYGGYVGGGEEALTDASSDAGKVKRRVERSTMKPTTAVLPSTRPLLNPAKADLFDVPSSDDDSDLTPRNNTHVVDTKCLGGRGVGKAARDSDSTHNRPRMHTGTKGQERLSRQQETVEDDGEQQGQEVFERAVKDNRKGQIAEVLLERGERSPGRRQARDKAVVSGGTYHNGTPMEATSYGFGVKERAHRSSRSRECAHPTRLAPPALDGNESGTSQKRKRTSPSQTAGSLETVPCIDSGPFLNDRESASVYDFPDPSADEQLSSCSMPTGRKVMRRDSNNRKAQSLQSKPIRRVSSTPGRVARLRPFHSDLSTASSHAPPATEDTVMLYDAPSTPPSKNYFRRAIDQDVIMSPQQATLWGRLLGHDQSTNSPSKLPMGELDISHETVTKESISATVLKQRPAISRRGQRLVDRLKASAPPSDGDLSDANAESERTEVQPLLATKDHSQRNIKNSDYAQSSERPTGVDRAKRTYAATRSYLPEDSIEDDLALGMIVELTPKARPNRLIKTKIAAKAPQSDYDLEDSDDAGTGGLRSIHELRAAGRNHRTLEDIDGLIRDVANHTASKKSRRRNALIELATNLAKRDFAERFISHGFEAHLIAEFDTSTDSIADFALTCAFLMLLHLQSSDQLVFTMKEAGALAWLAKLLNNKAEIGQLAKDRGNNMSRNSQASLNGLTELLQTSSLWEGHEIRTITPRVTAMKTLELIVKRLRSRGDHTELLDTTQRDLLLPGNNSIESLSDMMELEIALSLLELISSTPLTLEWSSKTLGRIGDMLLQAGLATQGSAKVLFIVLRLCLNITNADSRNCDELATPPVVQYLSQSVQNGFISLEAGAKAGDSDDQILPLDLLVLALGVMINLAEYSDQARQCATNETDTIETLVSVFRHGQKHVLEAESVEASVSNVAFGYLAILLANLCLNEKANARIASRLPNGGLGMLVDAVQEFVEHHQRADQMVFEGNEGREVWSAFTQKMEAVLQRLKRIADT